MRNDRGCGNALPHNGSLRLPRRSRNRVGSSNPTPRVPLLTEFLRDGVYHRILWKRHFVWMATSSLDEPNLFHCGIREHSIPEHHLTLRDLRPIMELEVAT